MFGAERGCDRRKREPNEADGWSDSQRPNVAQQQAHATKSTYRHFHERCDDNGSLDLQHTSVRCFRLELRHFTTTDVMLYSTV